MIRCTRQALLVLLVSTFRFHSGRGVAMHRWRARNHTTSRIARSVAHEQWMDFATPSGKRFDFRNTFGSSSPSKFFMFEVLPNCNASLPQRIRITQSCLLLANLPPIFTGCSSVDNHLIPLNYAIWSLFYVVLIHLKIVYSVFCWLFQCVIGCYLKVAILWRAIFLNSWECVI